jgi:23S rRNA U2552 (ribose-2'-O)-methylase RlmE/FtsJ
MNLTPAQQCELSSMLAQHGVDVVLRDLSNMIQDSVGDIISEELQTAILTNAADVMKAADSITYRAYTGRDLYRNDAYIEAK